MTIDRFQGEYRFLSNFWPAQVSLYGHLYPTVEHAYQAAKSASPLEREAIRKASTAGSAKRLGKNVTLRDDWESVRLSIMAGLLRQKFSSDPLRSQLLATGDADIVEGNTWGDTFWGVYRGSGQNHLGRLLMELRGRMK